VSSFDALDAGPEGGHVPARDRVWPAARARLVDYRASRRKRSALKMTEPRAEAHRRARNDRTQQEAEDRVEHARGDRHAERVVDEGEERFSRILRMVA